MKTPSTIASWCMVLFFLVYGIAAFVPIPASGMILGILALGAGILTLVGK